MVSAANMQLMLHALRVRQERGFALRNQPDAIEESQVYVGLNDSKTREQKLELDRYASILKKICVSYGVPFSFNFVEGGYIHDDGEFTEEKSIVLTLIDVPAQTVDEIARELCVLFNQESVLVTTDRVRLRSVREEL